MKSLLKESVVVANDIQLLSTIQEASAVICQRELPQEMVEEAAKLLNDPDFEGIRALGTREELIQELEELAHYPAIQADIVHLLSLFFSAVGTESVRFAFIPVRNGMCRKFHTDVTDYRLLCTYKGVGTEIIRPENSIPGSDLFEQMSAESLKEGEVLLFRGALSATEEYPPLLHKSPAVNHPTDHRLLLRLDTNMTAWE
ncbi:MAG: DUF1826 domain-containing protein [Flammeovirgaceae bacterium]